MDKTWEVGLTAEALFRIKADDASYGVHGELELLDDSQELIAVFAPTRWDYARVVQS